VRKGKQCRERWINHLNPQINKGPFSIEEDILMIEKQIQHGNRWAHIATFLVGRTENQVKNRFKHIQKKYVEGKYGKEFYREYSKEKVDKNTIENLDKPDKIIDELLEVKKMELNSNQEKTINAYNTPTKVNIIKPIANYQSEFIEILFN
jgi:Myb-like DNA-binding protein FlbD